MDMQRKDSFYDLQQQYQNQQQKVKNVSIFTVVLIAVRLKRAKSCINEIRISKNGETIGIQFFVWRALQDVSCRQNIVDVVVGSIRFPFCIFFLWFWMTVYRWYDQLHTQKMKTKLVWKPNDGFVTCACHFMFLFFVWHAHHCTVHAKVDDAHSIIIFSFLLHTVFSVQKIINRNNGKQFSFFCSLFINKKKLYFVFV